LHCDAPTKRSHFSTVGMSNIIRFPNSSSVQLADIVQQAQNYAEQSRSANTLRAYRADWGDFILWCDAHKFPCLPATVETVALYLTAKADALKVSTMARRLTAISEAHKIAGHPSPCEDERIKTIWKGIRRTNGVARTEKKPLLTEELRLLFGYLPENLQGVRDRALILLGYVGAFRRSELVALDRYDLSFIQEGIIVSVRRSKTDQEGIGTEKAIPYSSAPDLCPVRAILAWISATPQISGPLFVSIGKGDKLHHERLSDKAVSLIVKRLIGKVRDNSEYSGHSLRSGFATQAALNGASDRAIMQQTKHRSRAMVDRYVRVASLWQDNGATKLGL
jgi:site-specific recombinase XerD